MSDMLSTAAKSGVEPLADVLCEIAARTEIALRGRKGTLAEMLPEPVIRRLVIPHGEEARISCERLTALRGSYDINLCRAYVLALSEAGLQEALDGPLSRVTVPFALGTEVGAGGEYRVRERALESHRKLGNPRKNTARDLSGQIDDRGDCTIVLPGRGR